MLDSIARPLSVLEEGIVKLFHRHTHCYDVMRRNTIDIVSFVGEKHLNVTLGVESQLPELLFDLLHFHIDLFSVTYLLNSFNQLLEDLEPPIAAFESE